MDLHQEVKNASRIWDIKLTIPVCKYLDIDDKYKYAFENFVPVKQYEKI